MNEADSAIECVDAIISKAITHAASDIHFEPNEHTLRIRYRIDGILYDREPISSLLALKVISRIKILAKLDIAEKRIPQDGKFTVAHDSHEIDLRVSSFPALYGEKIVIRILDRNLSARALHTLGMPENIYENVCALINKQNGFILVAGPTGSGKTTTLYAILNVINKAENNIITLEDPVEYNIAGITQGQIHPVAGFTFARGIRAMLRQDPDVVMVGEMRDKETARIAIEASLTGHLVLSTVHTNSAPGVIMRIMDMGIEPYLINASVTGVLAQRLARKLCPLCRFSRPVLQSEKALLDKVNVSLSTLYESRGCDSCFNLGYKGRIGIFQLLVVSNELRSLVVQYPSFKAIEQQALDDGMYSLVIDAGQKVKEGIISLQEMTRILL